MAVRATRAKPLLVDVIFPVTCMAITGCCVEYCSQVTLFARSYRMHSVQWKAGHGMIETDLSTPAVFIIDQSGQIVWSYVGQSASDRPSVQTILENLPQP